MKRILILSILGVFSLSIGQEDYSKADKLFDRMWYKEAAELYEAEIDEDNYDMELLQKAGDSYFFNTDMQNAFKWYDVLVNTFYSEVPTEYLFRYAHSLQGVGKHREAKRWMKEFAKRAKKDDRSENFDQEGITVEDILSIEPAFVLRNVSTNTKFSDFGPMYYQDKLIYSSAVDSSNFHTRIYHWNEQPFLNLYEGKLNPIESDLTKIGEFSEELNTRYHEATLVFSEDGRTVWFTRNNYNGDLGRDSKGTNHLKLYSATLGTDDEGRDQWGNIKELPFNSEEYSVGHPALSADGKWLYFVSDMPGSIGGTDIFRVEILDESNYGNPQNLGETVNTAGREMFPFISESHLYFASDGHLGLGGLDVFSSAFNEDEFKTPINLGAPLNSEMDDFSFIVKEEENIGFVSSNRKGGKGDDDIYSFVRLAPAEGYACVQEVNGYISNSVTGERIANVNLTLYDNSGAVIEQTSTDINGNYRFASTLDCGANFKISAEKTAYNPREKSFITGDKSGETVVPIGLETVNELIVEEAGILKIKIGIIYFDLDESYIRNDAAIELNKIVLLMNQYPGMKIQIESHTDSRANDDYNIELSQRRAEATKEYLISQGIAAERIVDAKGFGETQLINECNNGTNCSEVKHQLNRRSEFIITSMD